MGYAILRIQKLKSAVAVHRSMKHSFRAQETPNADPRLTPENTHIGAQSVAEGMAAFRARLPAKHRKDAVQCIEYLIAGSPESMKSKSRAEQDAYFRDALEWLRARHGVENVIHAGIHRDETTPHMYAYVVPLDDDTGRLNAKKWFGGVKALNQMQTDFAEKVGRQHGLERGVERSKAKHQTIRQYYARVNEPAPKPPLLEAPAPSLADRLRPAEYGQRVVDSVIEQLQPTWSAMQAKARETGVQARRAEEMARSAQSAIEAKKRAEERLLLIERQFRPLVDLGELEPESQAQMLAASAKKAADLRRKRDIEQERKRRIEALRKPRRLAGAAATFAEHARSAIEAAGGNADQVEWARVEADSVKEAMAKNGQSAEDTARAINENSPLRADPASHEKLSEAIQRAAPRLTAEYEQHQQQARPAPGISR